MARIKWNDFINAHKTGICVLLSFSDYRSGLADRSGRVVPSPNQVASHLCKRFPGDIALKSHGKVQQLVLAEAADARRVAKMFGIGKFQQSLDPPCRIVAEARVDFRVHLKLARWLGLI
jgi:hypothetical protein